MTIASVSLQYWRPYLGSSLCGRSVRWGMRVSSALCIKTRDLRAARGRHWLLYACHRFAEPPQVAILWSIFEGTFCSGRSVNETCTLQRVCSGTPVLTTTYTPGPTKSIPTPPISAAVCSPRFLFPPPIFLRRQMIGIAGMLVQELVNPVPIFA